MEDKDEELDKLKMAYCLCGNLSPVTETKVVERS